MDIITKLYLVIVCYCYVFTLEIYDAECIDTWPFCNFYNVPCPNGTDLRIDISQLCSKRCGLCTSPENDSQSAEVTCRDKLDCSEFNVTEVIGCQSDNMWYRENCRKSCNMCLSNNETSNTGTEVHDKYSTINIYHTSEKDGIGKGHWERDKIVIIFVISSVLFIIIIGNTIVYFAFVKIRKGDIHIPDGSSSNSKQWESCSCNVYQRTSIDNVTVANAEDITSSTHSSASLFFRSSPLAGIVTQLSSRNPGTDNGSKSSSVSNSTQSSVEYLNDQRDERNANIYMEYPVQTVDQTVWVNQDGLHYSTLELKKKQRGQCRPPPFSEKTEYACIDLQKSTTSIFEETTQL